MAEPAVIVVDEKDNVLGEMPKMEAHRKGVLHRAFSILIFNSRGDLLLQRRALSKYHTPGLWTNTCCSHPDKDGDMKRLAEDRLEIEMGFRVPLEHRFEFIYRAEVNNDLIEHEYDHVFTGVFDGQPSPNPEEVMDIDYISLRDLNERLRQNPAAFTPWFRIILEKMELID